LRERFEAAYDDPHELTKQVVESSIEAVEALVECGALEHEQYTVTLAGHADGTAPTNLTISVTPAI
jgi:hypothetical protein